MDVDQAKSKPTDPKEKNAFKIEPYSFPDGMRAHLLYEFIEKNLYIVSMSGMCGKFNNSGAPGSKSISQNPFRGSDIF